ncbi:hypothetical protein OTU49_012258 [Cherax quadricarinatus]|uniref:Uncharacterized protein n=1 Tax=Cherax quadricarinatus TaxID=27406 RepID=A0AAW0W069_CHEQU
MTSSTHYNSADVIQEFIKYISKHPDETVVLNVQSMLMEIPQKIDLRPRASSTTVGIFLPPSKLRMGKHRRCSVKRLTRSCIRRQKRPGILSREAIDATLHKKILSYEALVIKE